MVEFTNIQIGYRETLIYIDKLQLNRGKLYTLIGKNGIGKTTLLDTLSGITHPVKGNIFIAEKNIHQLKSVEKAKLVAHVPSKFEGIQHLSVKEYISMGRIPYTNFIGNFSSEDLDIVSQVIEKLNIQHLTNKDTSQLSDGERQIASIGKSLVQQTPVILLDEPTAFLDYANRMSVLSMLKKIAHESNICILQTSHDLELCLEFSDELLIVDPKQKKIELLHNENLNKYSIIELAFPSTASN
jgi:iron complex transport system ATP-binding protein